MKFLVMCGTWEDVTVTRTPQAARAAYLGL